MPVPDTTSEKFLRGFSFFLSDTAGRRLLGGFVTLSALGTVFLKYVPDWLVSSVIVALALIVLLLVLTFPILVKRGRRFGDRLAGKWHWQGHLKVVFFSDGKVVSDADNGTWKCLDYTDLNIVVNWSKGYIDTLEVSEDFCRLTGTNQNGEVVCAEKSA